MIEVTGSRSEIVHEALPTDDPQVRQPDITLAREMLGWEPTVELREGLRRTLDEAGVEALTGAGRVAAARIARDPVAPSARETPNQWPTPDVMTTKPPNARAAPGAPRSCRPAAGRHPAQAPPALSFLLRMDTLRASAAWCRCWRSTSRASSPRSSPR